MNSPALKTITFASVTVAVFVFFYVLVVGRELIIPFVFAVFLWYLINALYVLFTKLKVRGWSPPKALAMTLAILTILVVLGFVANLIRDNVQAVITAAPRYQANLERVVEQFAALAGTEGASNIEEFFAQVDFGAWLVRIANSLAGFLGSASLVFAYLFFLFIEQQYFRPKLDNLFADTKNRESTRKLLARIEADIRTYIGVKTLVSILTALVSYAIMKSVGLDFAEFWAFLIFLFNYIPNIGSLVATVLPSVLALVQFETWIPFAVIAGGVTAVQLTVGNFIEPRLMGQRLNLSPLIIILSLVLWGSLWGIPGLFLCVPLTAVTLIILSNFPSTRPLAVLLSQTGQVRPVQ